MSLFSKLILWILGFLFLYVGLLGYIVKVYSLPKSKFRKILVENATIIAFKINILRQESTSEISRPVHIPRQWHLIYWKWCQYASREGVLFYWTLIDHMEVWSIRYIKTEFLPSCGCGRIHTTIWTITKQVDKKLDGNYKRNQQPKKQLLYGLLLSTSQTILIRRTKYVEDCWRSQDGLSLTLHIYIYIYIYI